MDYRSIKKLRRKLFNHALWEQKRLRKKREVSAEMASQYAQKKKFSFIETSALTGKNVDLAFNQLIQCIYFILI